MNNLQRLQMETKGIDFQVAELMVYLLENGLDATAPYDATSQANTKAIYQTALSVLESLANNPQLMKTIKIDDMTVSDFHDNLMNRIDQLTRKVRTMKTENGNSNFFIFYN